MPERSEQPLEESLYPPLPTEDTDFDDFDLKGSLDQTIRLANVVSRGLRACENMLRANSPDRRGSSISVVEMRRVQRFQTVIGIKLGRMKAMHDALHMDAEIENPTWIFRDGHWAMKLRLIETHLDDKTFIENARAYLINCHVFYKINYALCKENDASQIK